MIKGLIMVLWFSFIASNLNNGIPTVTAYQIQKIDKENGDEFIEISSNITRKPNLNYTENIQLNLEPDEGCLSSQNGLTNENLPNEIIASVKENENINFKQEHNMFDTIEDDSLKWKLNDQGAIWQTSNNFQFYPKSIIMKNKKPLEVKNYNSDFNEEKEDEGGEAIAGEQISFTGEVVLEDKTDMQTGTEGGKSEVMPTLPLEVSPKFSGLLLYTNRTSPLCTKRTHPTCSRRTHPTCTKRTTLPICTKRTTLPICTKRTLPICTKKTTICTKRTTLPICTKRTTICTKRTTLPICTKRTTICTKRTTLPICTKRTTICTKRPTTCTKVTKCLKTKTTKMTTPKPTKCLHPTTTKCLHPTTPKCTKPTKCPKGATVSLIKSVFSLKPKNETRPVENGTMVFQTETNERISKFNETRSTIIMTGDNQCEEPFYSLNNDGYLNGMDSGLIRGNNDENIFSGETSFERFKNSDDKQMRSIKANDENNRSADTARDKSINGADSEADLDKYAICSKLLPMKDYINQMKKKQSQKKTNNGRQENSNLALYFDKYAWTLTTDSVLKQNLKILFDPKPIIGMIPLNYYNNWPRKHRTSDKKLISKKRHKHVETIESKLIKNEINNNMLHNEQRSTTQSCQEITDKVKRLYGNETFKYDTNNSNVQNEIVKAKSNYEQNIPETELIDQYNQRLMKELKNYLLYTHLPMFTQLNRVDGKSKLMNSSKAGFNKMRRNSYPSAVMSHKRKGNRVYYKIKDKQQP